MSLSYFNLPQLGPYRALYVMFISFIFFRLISIVWMRFDFNLRLRGKLKDLEYLIF